jgi:hypothetical protein
LLGARFVIAQNHADVDPLLSQSRKTEKITSSGVGPARFNRTTFRPKSLLAMSFYAQLVMQNSDVLPGKREH